MLASLNTSASVVFRHVRKIANTDCQLRHVCPNGKLDSHWTDFKEI